MWRSAALATLAWVMLIGLGLPTMHATLRTPNLKVCLSTKLKIRWYRTCTFPHLRCLIHPVPLTPYSPFMMFMPIPKARLATAKEEFRAVWRGYQQGLQGHDYTQ